MPYKILTFDGGGIRGVLSMRIVERIAEQYPALIDNVDLIAGTSAGAINAVALAMPGAAAGTRRFSPSDIVRLFQDKGPEIFHHTALGELISADGITRSRYSTEGIKSALAPYYQDAGGAPVPLESLAKKVLVVSFQLDSHNPINPVGPGQSPTWNPKFFHNFPTANADDYDGAQAALDVVLRSAAAPVYFPIYQGFVDGGVAANNPSMCAVAQAITPTAATGGAGAGKNPTDLLVLSIGTGTRPINIPNRDASWGLTGWGFKLIDLLSESGTGVPDYQCQQLLGDCYRRVNVDMTDDIGLDAVDRIPDLITAAGRVPVGPLVDWLRAKGW